MGSRVKKNATAAAARLKSRLGRDQDGLRLLASLTRYLGELRQERTALHEQLELVNHNTEQATLQLMAARNKVTALEAQLAQQQAVNRQLTGDLKRALQEMADLRPKPEADDDPDLSDVPPDSLEDLTRFLALSKTLRRRMPRPPKCMGLVAKTHPPWRVNLSDVVTKYSSDDYCLLGMFVAVLALWNMPVVVEADKTIVERIHALDDKYSIRHARWLRRWIDWWSTERRLNGLLDTASKAEPVPTPLPD